MSAWPCFCARGSARSLGECQRCLVKKHWSVVSLSASHMQLGASCTVSDGALYHQPSNILSPVRCAWVCNTRARARLQRAVCCQLRLLFLFTEMMVVTLRCFRHLCSHLPVRKSRWSLGRKQQQTQDPLCPRALRPSSELLCSSGPDCPGFSTTSRTPRPTRIKLSSSRAQGPALPRLPACVLHGMYELPFTRQLCGGVSCTWNLHVAAAPRCGRQPNRGRGIQSGCCRLLLPLALFRDVPSQPVHATYARQH